MSWHPNGISLNESTNDLDIPSAQVLEDAPSDFEGRLLIISPDEMVANYALVAADRNLYPGCVAAAKEEAILGSMGLDPKELYARRKSFWEYAPAEFCQWCRIENTYMGKRAWRQWH